MPMSIDKFMKGSVAGWMKASGEHADIVMSTRIRLARNLRGHLFPIASNPDDANHVDEVVKEVLLNSGEKGYEYMKMSDVPLLERQILVEKHLISPQLTDSKRNGAVILSEDETVSLMINEEDHIRIQCIYPGFQLENAYEHADSVDNELEDKLPYAFDEEFGYLTSCPSNTGTGMRASVMMHLPALTITKQIDRIIPAVTRLGMVVRGSYGEGSEALGNIYQISNQTTLGKTEKEILADLKNVALRLIAHERRSREVLLSKSKIALENKLFRSLGIIKYARLLPSGEAARCLSDVRLGIDLDIIKDIDMSILNELMIFMQPGFLQQYARTELTAEERDIFRADLFRERLSVNQVSESEDSGE